jgi:hypothetical protein
MLGQLGDPFLRRDYEDDDGPPTIPAPAQDVRESGVRLRVSKVPSGAATVDVVVCDLTRDPRSEAYLDGAGEDEAGQNDIPPSTSIVRALK